MRKINEVALRVIMREMGDTLTPKGKIRFHIGSQFRRAPKGDADTKWMCVPSEKPRRGYVVLTHPD